MSLIQTNARYNLSSIISLVTVLNNSNGISHDRQDTPQDDTPSRTAEVGAVDGREGHEVNRPDGRGIRLRRIELILLAGILEEAWWYGDSRT